MQPTVLVDGMMLTSSSNYLALLILELVASIVLPRGRTWRRVPSSDVVSAAVVSVTNGSILYGNAFTWIANYVHTHRVTHYQQRTDVKDGIGKWLTRRWCDVE
jgi:hypothetical protein